MFERYDRERRSLFDVDWLEVYLQKFVWSRNIEPVLPVMLDIEKPEKILERLREENPQEAMMLGEWFVFDKDEDKN